MDLEKLSDKQLYELIKNNSLTPEIKNALNNEFLQRDFSIQYIDELSLAYEKIDNQTPQIGLSLSTKISIILFPWIFPLQAIIANKHIANNNKRKWNQHWLFVAVDWILACHHYYYSSSNIIQKVKH